MNALHDDGEAVRLAVREHYAAAARSAGEQEAACGAGGSGGCCGSEPARGIAGTDPITADNYAAEKTAGLSSALSASLGCGNPTALITLAAGQRVLDLGSGGGLDVLLSARRVGPTGFAYGVDMTEEMLELARRHQREAGVVNAEFLAGTIEAVPLPDEAVDVVISNCVINLAADKDEVLAEAFRVLTPGGRFAVSDVVLTRPLPPAAQQVVALWTGCVAGALVDQDYLQALTRAGFVEPSVEVTRRFDRAALVDLARRLDPAQVPTGLDVSALLDEVDGAVVSAFVRAVKPA